nr:prenyltransferase/squalene oxidase repeat-containing protein [Streptomyces chartreusis]
MGASENAMTTAEVLSAALEAKSTKLLDRKDQLVDWLLAAQQTDGHWTDPNSPDPWDVSSTAWAAWALMKSSPYMARNEIDKACNWLEESTFSDGGLPTHRGATRPNTYAASYSLRTLSQRGSPTLGKIHRYLTRTQNSDGGWGLYQGEPSEATLTDYVLHGLLDAGTTSDEEDHSLSKGLRWVSSRVRPNDAWGSWLEDGDSVEGTAFSIYILRRGNSITQNTLLAAMRFLSRRVKEQTAWSIDGKDQVWVAVSSLLASWISLSVGDGDDNLLR